MRMILIALLLWGVTTQARALEIVVDQNARKLHVIDDAGNALKTYDVAIGREGFRVPSGVHQITRKQLDPDWYPPAEMIAREPALQRLPIHPVSKTRYMRGGPGNPLGDAALYIGATQYRIHGTYVPSKIGLAASSGCFRMTNENVMELYEKIPIGTKITVR